MTKRFGFGEFERKDVDVPNSTWEMRHHFLSVLKDYRPDLFRQLFLPSGVDVQWLNDLDYNRSRLVDYLFVARAFGKDLEKGDLRFLPRDSALSLYIIHLESKSEELTHRLEEVRAEGHRFSERAIRANGIARVVGTWAELQKEDSAASVCRSLKAWSIKNNLNEGWVVEFVLMLFKNLIASLDPLMNSLAFISEDDAKNMNERFQCEAQVREAFGKTMMEHHSLRVTKNLWEFPEDLPELPHLEFKYRDLVLPPRSWSFYTERRKEFSDHVLDHFDSVSAALKDLDNYPSIDVKSYREGVRNYCESVDTSDKNGGQEGKAHTIRVHPNLILHSATWNPASQSKSEFVRAYLKGLKSGFDHLKQMANSIDSKAREQLESEIYSYCNKIALRKPASYERTPRKHSGNRDFIWLIDVQVPPVRTYQEIASSYKQGNEVTASGVQKAVKRLAKAIKLDLRVSPRTGRPKGVREVGKRRRVH